MSRISASVSSMGRQKARELKDAGRDVISLTTSTEVLEEGCARIARACAALA